MKTLTALEKEKLKLESEKHIASLDYGGICQICPRGEHWWQAPSENSLYDMQRKTATNRVYERLLKAAQDE